MSAQPLPFNASRTRGVLPGPEPRIAVLIPCYNEELTVAHVINGFREQLPEAEIFVFDNNSTDRTVEIAQTAGAVVLRERRQGKGHVVQTMFREIDADIYIMVDGDGTYPAADVHRLLAPVLDGDADMVVGARLEDVSTSSFKFLNRIGNRFFLHVTNRLFRSSVRDMLSGYRVFTRSVVKELPLLSSGFEIETELTIKALERQYRIVELPVDLGPRPAGSFSKIRVVRDGVIILNMIFALLRDYKPLTIFGAAGLLCMTLGLIPGGVVIAEYLRTGLVPKLPSAVLAVGLELSGLIFWTLGLVLHTIVRRFQELDLQLRLFHAELSNSPQRTQQPQRAAISSEFGPTYR